MTKDEYLREASRWKIDSELVARVEHRYSVELPELLKRIVSHSEDPVFFDDGTHILSYAEVIDAEDDLHVDFSGRKIIPVADCLDNDYIVYDYEHDVWALFNTTDEILFKERESLEELLK